MRRKFKVHLDGRLDYDYTPIEHCQVFLSMSEIERQTKILFGSQCKAEILLQRSQESDAIEEGIFQ